MQMKRVWKPLVLAVAIGATSLFYSCRKFDPGEYLDGKQSIEDTATFGKKKFMVIGKRAFADTKPMADTISTDTLPVVPLKLQSDFVLSKNAK